MRTTILRALAVGVMGWLAACSSAGGASPGGEAGRGRGKGGANAGDAGGVAGDGEGGGEPGGGEPGGAGGESPFGGSGGVLVVGGGPGSGGQDSCAAVAQKADAKVVPADIIWVIDTSGSMNDETKQVRERMNNFAQGILSVGIDVRVVLVAQNFECPPFGCNNPLFPPEGICLPAPLGSGKCPDDSKLPTYLHEPTTIGSQDGLLKILESYPKWKGMLRQDSVKFLVAVTDDNATQGAYAPGNFPDQEKGAAKKFVEDFTALDPAVLTGFKLSGIYCFSECKPWVAQVGTVWDALVDATGGVKGDLCKQDFQPIFNALAKGVVSSAKLDCQWKIPAPPAGKTFDPALVNVSFTSGSGASEDVLFASSLGGCDPQKGGWYYDNPAKPSAVVACPATCTKIQADTQGKIDVLFGCATRPIE